MGIIIVTRVYYNIKFIINFNLYKDFYINNNYNNISYKLIINNYFNNNRKTSN